MIFYDTTNSKFMKKSEAIAYIARCAPVTHLTLFMGIIITQYFTLSIYISGKNIGVKYWKNRNLIFIENK